MLSPSPWSSVCALGRSWVLSSFNPFRRGCGGSRSGLRGTLSAKQRGGCQGGTTHLQSPLISATCKSECAFPLTKSRVLSCLFFFFNLEIWFLKHFVFLPRHLLHVIFQVASVKTPLLSPARSPHGTQLQTQPLQLGWLDSQHPKTQSSLNPIPVKVLAAPELLPAPSSAGFSP